MKRVRVPVVAAAAALCAACGGESFEAAAVTALRSHFVAIAPAGIPDATWATVTIEIEETRDDPASEDGRVVAFRVYDPDRAAEGRGPVYDAALTPSADGTWSVARYGPGLKPVVAAMVTLDRRARYDGLLRALREVQDSAATVFRTWRRGLRAELVENPDAPVFDRVGKALDAGIPAALLTEALGGRTAAFPDSLVWGVRDEHPADGAEYVWVARTDRPDERCGQWIGPQLPGPDAWLEGRFPTCMGRGGRYVERAGHQAVLDEIDRAGGALLPGNGAGPR